MDLGKVYKSKNECKSTVKKTTKKGNRKLMILGTAPSLKLVRWDAPGYDIWACSPVITQPCAIPHIDKIQQLYEMHPMEYWNTIIKRLNDTNLPVYMQVQVP